MTNLERREGEGMTEFAVRRIRAEIVEECALLAESLSHKPEWSPGYKACAKAIADRIRELKK